MIGEQREARKAERAQKQAEAKVEKERIVVEAEKLAAGTDWRNGANRLRELLDQWKALPRIDRPSDDALWRRFSTARTAYTKARKSHFAEQHEKREGARAVKERLVKEAEALAESTEWGPTSGEYRELMRRWKAAGPAPRDVDEELWKRFRAAQDTFFSARDAANAAQDAEFAANAELKEKLLVEAEALVPVTDLEPPRLPSATSPTAGTPPARCRASGCASSRAGSARSSRPSARVEEEQWRAHRPREVRARRRHGLQARGRHRQDRGRPRRRPGRRQREAGQGARREPRVPPGLPRDGQAAPPPTTRADSLRDFRWSTGAKSETCRGLREPRSGSRQAPATCPRSG